MKLRGRAGVWAVPVVAGLLLLSGCGEIRPGTASVVNGTRITNDEVNDLADAQCVAAERAAQSGQQTTAAAIASVKQQALDLLIDTELSLQFGKDEGITPDKVLYQGFYQQFGEIIETLPATSRGVLADVFQNWAKGQATLVQAGSAATGTPADLQNVEQLATAGLGKRATWLKKADITTDPRYGPNKDGFPRGGDGSVSRAGSTFAKAAVAKEPDPKWVSGLPADQRCG